MSFGLLGSLSADSLQRPSPLCTPRDLLRRQGYVNHARVLEPSALRWRGFLRTHFQQRSIIEQLLQATSTPAQEHTCILLLNSWFEQQLGDVMLADESRESL